MNKTRIIFFIYISSLWIEPENKDTAVEESNRLKGEINALRPYEWKAKNHDNINGQNGDGLKISVIFKIFFPCSMPASSVT